jgi:hypothetical protein
MTTDWSVEARPGWFHRLIVPQRGGRPSSLALGIAAAGALAFILSISMDWRIATLNLGNTGSGPQQQVLVMHGGVGDTNALAVAYLLGMVALLGVVGAAIGRPEVALRIRLPVLGVGVGLIGVVLAVFTRKAGIESAIASNFGGFLPDLEDRLKTAPGPGSFVGLAAVVLLVAAVWMAGRAMALADAAAARGPAADADVEPETERAPGIYAPHNPNGFGLAARGGGVYDLTVIPDDRPNPR